MIHLYAPPGALHDTLCGLDSAWARRPVSAVYGRDFHQVDCPKCLAKLQMPPIDLPERVHRERDLVYGMCWIVVGSFLFLIGLWWLT